jgi:outer membrane protein
MSIKFNKINLFLMIVLISLILPGTGGTAAAQAMPPAGASTAALGIVDYIYLINQHPDTVKANEILQAEQEKARRELTESSAGMSASEKQELDRQLGARVEQKRQELLKPISAKISAAIKAVADAKGLAVILPKEYVIYGGLDITYDVLLMIKGK